MENIDIIWTTYLRSIDSETVCRMFRHCLEQMLICTRLKNIKKF